MNFSVEPGIYLAGRFGISWSNGSGLVYASAATLV
jgi:hypothetical protein